MTPPAADPAPDADLAPVLPVLAAVREAAPLVHCLTATVSMQLVADGLLAAGARPMMTETLAEAPVVTTLADALLINLGTLSSDAMEGIPATVEVTHAEARPWVLDPTAIGLAPVRTPLARQLLEQRPTVVRGNASEVLALVGAGTGGRGADSTASADCVRRPRPRSPGAPAAPSPSPARWTWCGMRGAGDGSPEAPCCCRV